MYWVREGNRVCNVWVGLVWRKAGLRSWYRFYSDLSPHRRVVDGKILKSIITNLIANIFLCYW